MKFEVGDQVVVNPDPDATVYVVADIGEGNAAVVYHGKKGLLSGGVCGECSLMEPTREQLRNWNKQFV